LILFLQLLAGKIQLWVFAWLKRGLQSAVCIQYPGIP
jgi:hypothetical protein